MATGTDNLASLAKAALSDENWARELLERLRWPNGVSCPHCGGADPYRLNTRPTAKNPGRIRLWKCSQCAKQFNVTVGTVFEGSHIPVRKWLMAIHLICASKKGMSAHQIHRMLGMTYRSAWFLMHRLRRAMETNDGLFAQLTGVVEADENYVGARNKRGTKRGRSGPDSHKAPVIALVARGGQPRLFPMERVTSNNLRAALRKHVHPSSTLMTDEFSIYEEPGKEFGAHHKVNHGFGEYARGEAHEHRRGDVLAAQARHQRQFPSRVEGPSAALRLGVRVQMEQPVGARLQPPLPSKDKPKKRAKSRPARKWSKQVASRPKGVRHEHRETESVRRLGNGPWHWRERHRYASHAAIC